MDKFSHIGYIFIIIFIFCVSRGSSQIYLNEFQAYNADSYLNQETGNYSDWIEIYNSNNHSVDLAGYALTDDIYEPDKWRIQSNASIPPNDFLIIWADNLDYDLHTNFSLAGKAGKIILHDPGNEIVDSVSYGQQLPDISFGRQPTDGSWFFLDHPTPGEENAGPVRSVHFSVPPEFSIVGGFYGGSQLIQLGSTSPGAEIHYTIDGSIPTKNAILYSEAIQVDETTVIRAVSLENDLLPSKTITQTYFIGVESTLPVISISTDHENLWDEQMGIYTQENCTKEWERTANIEFYETNGMRAFSHQVGISIHGGYNQILPMKSLAVRARNKYDTDKIKHKIFKDKSIEEFTSFILRNSGNDWSYTMLRDGLMQTIVKSRMDIDYQEYQPSIVFINGAYWGIHNIREKMNEYFIEGNHGIDPDSVDILEKAYLVNEGDSESYEELMDFILSHDLRDMDHYSFVKDRVDIEEFNNYQIANIYFKNQDWPNNNIKKWRSKTKNGQWRWFLFDTDWGFGLHQDYENMVEWTIAQNMWYENFNTLLFENREFRDDFLQCFQGHMNTTFQPARVLSILDSLKGNIEAEFPAHISRWGEPENMTTWESEISAMRNFAANRLPTLKTNLSNFFYLSGEYVLSAGINNSTGGTIKINHVDLPDNFTGTYFKDIPIQIEALPAQGFTFTGWQGASNSVNSEIELVLSSDASITAIFGPTEPMSHIHINELSSKSENAIQDDFGESEDWIEIYNSGSDPLQLAGLFLTDSLPDLDKHMIPLGNSNSTIVYPDSSLVLYADSDPEQGSIHLNFKLSNQGETILLSQRVGDELIILDSVSYCGQFAGTATGRLPDGTGDWQITLPTPRDLNMGIPFLSGLHINEFSASNHSISDNHGEYDDWIEIYNDNEEPVDVGGLFLTDSLADETDHWIPTTSPDSTTIPSKGYLVLWADNQPEQGILHLGFGLRREGEQIGLVQKDGTTFIDSLTYKEQYAASSLSRYPDGADDWELLPSTPGSGNTTKPVTGLYINEFSASNQSISDNQGEYDDWIEIYNDNEEPVDIGGLFMTDSLADGTNHRIPTTSPDSTTIPPKGYLVLWADNQPEQGILHLGFGLRRSGEQIGLLQYNGDEYIDSLTYNEQYSDVSVSRYPDGEEGWFHLPSTPGDENVYQILSGLYITEFSASNVSYLTDNVGEYADWIELYNDNDAPVDVGGLFITDSLANGTRYRIPTTSPDSTTIPSKDYLVLWADNQLEQGILHLGFGLRRSGEQIGLLQYNGIDYIDSLTFGQQFVNASVSKNGEELWQFVPSTPGSSNYSGVMSGIHITEFSASNQLILADEYDEYDDWIELYNDSDTPLDVGGLYLTDSLADETKFRIPTTFTDSTTIPSKGYLVLWADNQPEQGILHLGFGLKRGGEQIGLVDYDCITYMDSLTYNEQYVNASLSRIPHGSTSWIPVPPTPGEMNDYVTVSGLYINEFSSSNSYLMMDNYGEYDDWIEIYNDNDRAVDLGGLFITDSLADGTRHRIPTTAPDSTTIPAKGFKILWADNQEEQGVLHLDFGLTREGEEIGLLQYNGWDYIDTLTYGEILANTSLSRYPDGTSSWLSMNSTPGQSNIKKEYQRLCINEFRAGDPSKNSTAQYLEGNWIELFNNNEYEIDIGGLYMTNDLDHPYACRIPDTVPHSTTIPPKGFLLLWCDNMESEGILHMNFTLSQQGTEIGLARRIGDEYFYIDTLVSSYQHVSVSSGRVNDGVNSWTNFTDPTPGWSNSQSLTSVSRMESGDFKVYPNPVSNGMLYFTHPRSVDLYNHSGTFVKVKIDASHLNLTDLPAGFYILKTKQGEVIQIIIIQ